MNQDKFLLLVFFHTYFAQQKNDLNDNSLSKIDCLCIVQHHTKTKSRLSEIYEKSLVPFIYDCQSKCEKIPGAKTYLDSLGG